MDRGQASTVNPVQHLPKAAKFVAIPVQDLANLFPHRFVVTFSQIVTRPSQIVERRLHLFPKLFERLTTHRQPHESVRNLIAPARAPLGGRVHASETGGWPDTFAAIDEFLGGVLIA